MFPQKTVRYAISAVSKIETLNNVSIESQDSGWTLSNFLKPEDLIIRAEGLTQKM